MKYSFYYPESDQTHLQVELSLDGSRLDIPLQMDIPRVQQFLARQYSQVDLGQGVRLSWKPTDAGDWYPELSFPVVFSSGRGKDDRLRGKDDRGKGKGTGGKKSFFKVPLDLKRTEDFLETYIVVRGYGHRHIFDTRGGKVYVC